MSFELLGDLDWLAVVIAAAAYFVLGAIWYARPVLGKAWMDAGGMQIPAEGQRPGPAAIFAVPAAGSLLSAIALGMIAAAGTTSSATWSRRSSSRRSSICDRHGGRKVRQPRRRSRRG